MGENSSASMHVAWNTEQMEQNAQHPNRRFQVQQNSLFGRALCLVKNY